MAEPRACNDPNPIPLPDGPINTHRLISLMRKIEARAHGDGWDQPGAGLTLYLLYTNTGMRHTDVSAVAAALRGRSATHLGEGPTPALHVGRYTAQRLLAPAYFRDNRSPDDPGPFKALRRFALQAGYADTPDADKLRTLLRHPGALGFAVVYEAWDRGHIPDRVDTAPARADWGHIEGSRSVRVVMVVDYLDQVHTIRRSQDNDHINERPADPSRPTGIRGGLSTALRILTDTVFSRLPHPDRFDEHYPSPAAEQTRAVVEGSDIVQVSRIVNG